MTETRTDSELTAEAETEAPNSESTKHQPEKFMEVIPWQLQDESFRFTGILPEGEKIRGEVSDGKRPVHKWKKDPQQYNSPKMIKHLKKYPAYAVVCGYGNLVVLDIDDERGEAIMEELPETFVTLSANKKLPHIYLKVDTDEQLYGRCRYIPITEAEEVEWVENFNPKAISKVSQKPMIEVKGLGSILNGANSLIAEGKCYEPVSSAPIAEVTITQLQDALRKVGVSSETQHEKLMARLKSLRPDAYYEYISLSKKHVSHKESGKWYQEPLWLEIMESVTMKEAYEAQDGVFKSEHRQKCLFCGSVRGVDISVGKYICYSEGCKVWHTSPWFFYQAVEKHLSEKGKYDWKKCSLNFAKLAGKKYYKQWQDFLKSYKVEKKQKAIQQGNTESEKRLHEFNKNNFVAEINGVAKFCLETTNEFGEPVIRYRDKQHFVALNSRLEKIFVDERLLPFTKVWMEWSERRQYDGVIFQPVGIDKPYHNDRFYNMWRGFSVKPEAGECGRILHHLKEVTCDGNRAHFNYLMLWLAHMVQMPETKPGVAVVVKGKKGTGKSIVTERILQRMLGEHYGQYSSSESVIGKFNSHLKNKLLIVLEEAVWAGDPTSEGKLKAMITDREGDFEQKGMDKESCRSYCRLYFNTNERRSVPATLDERRYFVLRSSSKYKDNRVYFSKLIYEIENGGVEAFMELLKNYKVNDLDVRNPPITKALLEDVEYGMDAFNRWLYDLVSEPKHVCVNSMTGDQQDIVWGKSTPTAWLFNHYKQWVEDAKAARAYVGYSYISSRTGFTKALKEIFGLKKSTKVGTENALNLPDQFLAREMFLGKFQQFAEFEHALEGTDVFVQDNAAEANPFCQEMMEGQAVTERTEDEDVAFELMHYGEAHENGQAA